MNLKKIGPTLVVMLAIMATTASSAFAAAETKPAKWFVGGAPLVEAPKEVKALSASLPVGGTLELEDAGLGLTLSSPEVECVECNIFNEGGGARGEGKLKLKNVSVTKPAACKVSGGAILTKALKIDATYMIGNVNTILFAPAMGAVIANFKLEKGAGACPIAGAFNLSGSVFMETVNGTKVEAAEQEVKSSEAINTAGGGALEIANPATLTGNIRLSVGGALFKTE